MALWFCIALDLFVRCIELNSQLKVLLPSTPFFHLFPITVLPLVLPQSPLEWRVGGEFRREGSRVVTDKRGELDMQWKLN